MLDTFLKKTIWIFNHSSPESIPSYYVSGLMPAHFMGIRKVIFLNQHKPEELLNHFKPQCIILSKAFDIKLSFLAELAKKRGIKVISIFDDWNFSNKNRSILNLPIAKNSDFIISKTIMASNIIFKNTNIRSVVIPDPVRFNSFKIFGKFNKPLKACWFGMHTNHDTIINELVSLNSLDHKISLSIISNSFEKIDAFIKDKNFNNLKIKLINWNKRSDLEIVNSDVVLLPYPKDEKRLVKSSNRIIESLNLGRFTILSDVDQFSEFKDFTYFGNISKGIVWFLNNYESAHKITEEGQKYILNNYSLSNICDLWIKLFKDICGS